MKAIICCKTAEEQVEKAKRPKTPVHSIQVKGYEGLPLSKLRFTVLSKAKVISGQAIGIRILDHLAFLSHKSSLEIN